MIGICCGLLINMLWVSSALASTMISMDPAPAGPPQPIEEWGEPELIEANTMVYEGLFPGETWSSTSTFTVSSPMVSEGRNDGVSDQGDAFRLQAFVVDEYDISELTASLTQNEQDMWINNNVRASIFFGLMASESTGYSVMYPVVGWASSSDVKPDVELTITHVFEPETKDSLETLWHARSEGLSESLEGDWEYWFIPCPGATAVVFGGAGGADDPCVQILLDCGNEFDSNMRIAVAAYKAVIATAGTGCLVGGILFGAFCLVGNVLACATGGWLLNRCAIILGTATTAVVLAMSAAQIAYQDCVGSCYTAPGCP